MAVFADGRVVFLNLWKGAKWVVFFNFWKWAKWFKIFFKVNLGKMVNLRVRD
jgi:hypothetical protein